MVRTVHTYSTWSAPTKTHSVSFWKGRLEILTPRMSTHSLNDDLSVFLNPPPVLRRWITSGEYIQMSGRAGRRGKDDRGIVIQMLEEKMDPQVAKGAQPHVHLWGLFSPIILGQQQGPDLRSLLKSLRPALQHPCEVVLLLRLVFSTHPLPRSCCCALH